MKEILKEIIYSFWKEDLVKIIKRDNEVLKIGKGLNKAITLIGPRRSGKTSFCFQKINEILSKGLDKKKILYINFEDERLLNFKVEDFDILLKVYFELSEFSTKDEDIYFFFDEIQNVDFWEKFITILVNNFKINVWITGSSAKMLSKEINTGLRGKNIVFEILPLDFEEFLKFKKINLDKNFVYSIDETNEYKKSLKEFLKFGAFPEVVLQENILIKKNIIKNYYDLIFYKDIVERYNVRDISSLKKFRKILTHNFTQKLSLKKVSKELEIDYKTIINWFEYFCDSYFGFALKKFNFSVLEVEKSMSKFYLIDNSFFSVNFLGINNFNFSTLFENQVFLEIKKSGLIPGENIFYFEENGQEIDFIIFYEGELICIQVSYNIEDEKTKKREIKSLNYVKQKYGVENLIVVLADEIKSYEENEIKFLSFYDFSKYIKKI